MKEAFFHFMAGWGFVSVAFVSLMALLAVQHFGTLLLVMMLKVIAKQIGYEASFLA